MQIFEDEWIQKKGICKSRLRNIFQKTPYRIYARKCTIRDVSGELKDKFLRKYHIQGADKSVVHKGLFNKNRLVALMTFGPLRDALGFKNKKEGWELVRFCTMGSFAVVGGADRLLKAFVAEHNPHKILTYADRRWSVGKLYENLKFKHQGNTVPGYCYIVGNTRKHRFGFQKHTLAEKLKTFDPALSESDNMAANGYFRIWDCGHAKYLWEKSA